MLELLGRVFAGRSKRTNASSPRPRSRHDPAEHQHGPVEEWFIRTARMLLRSRHTSVGAPKPSPLQQRIETLETENTLLRADYQRLADEVVALRTLVYVRRQHGGA